MWNPFLGPHFDCTVSLYIISTAVKCGNSQDLLADSNMENTPVWDSLKKIDVIFAVEDKFGVKFNSFVNLREYGVAEF